MLADLPGDSAAAQGGTRLAHDTLAPLVRRDYDHSAHPAQQAARLLESRAVDWSDDRTGALLDDNALALVDKGVWGMRSLSADEQRLLAASRTAQVQRRRQRRFWRTAAAVAAGAILGLLVISLLLLYSRQFEAERAKRIDAERQAAEERSRSAELNNRLTRQRELAALQLAGANESQRLAELSRQQLTVDPVVSLHLALASLSGAGGQPLVPEAEFALRQAVLNSRERKYIPVTAAGPDAIAMRGNRVAVGGARLVRRVGFAAGRYRGDEEDGKPEAMSAMLSHGESSVGVGSPHLSSRCACSMSAEFLALASAGEQRSFPWVRSNLSHVTAASKRSSRGACLCRAVLRAPSRGMSASLGGTAARRLDRREPVRKRRRCPASRNGCPLVSAPRENNTRGPWRTATGDRS